MTASKASVLRRANIEHIVRAVSGVSGQMKLVLIGTGGVIAQLKITPLPLMMTRELDVYALDTPDVEGVSTLIDATIGEGSHFDQSFGYYAHGVGPDTAVLPSDWASRAVEVTWPNAPGVTCICPDIDDIALSKLCAGREKDLRWLKAANAAGLLDLAAIGRRAASLTQVDELVKAEMLRRLVDLKSSPAPGAGPGVGSGI